MLVLVLVQVAGLVLTYAFLVPYFLSMLAMIITNLNAYFTSLAGAAATTPNDGAGATPRVPLVLVPLRTMDRPSESLCLFSSGH